MFGLFKKKNKAVGVSSEPYTVVVEVPAQQSSCPQPAEHAKLAKIRELQLEKEQINEFLKSDPFEFDAPELTKFTDFLSNRTADNVCDLTNFRPYWKYHSEYLQMLSRIYKRGVMRCAGHIDFEAISKEICSFENSMAEYKKKKDRLAQVKGEITALKKSLGI